MNNIIVVVVILILIIFLIPLVIISKIIDGGDFCKTSDFIYDFVNAKIGHKYETTMHSIIKCNTKPKLEVTPNTTYKYKLDSGEEGSVEFDTMITDRETHKIYVFEFNGPMHYKRPRNINSYEKWVKSRKNDDIKATMHNVGTIVLTIVPYQAVQSKNMEYFEDYVISRLFDLKILRDSPYKINYVPAIKDIERDDDQYLRHVKMTTGIDGKRITYINWKPKIQRVKECKIYFWNNPRVHM